VKNKTVAAWLAFLGGPFGLHRFYLHGLGDLLGWLLPIPTALGLYGVERVRLYGLMTPEKWNARFNQVAAPDAAPGHTNWFTIGAIVLSLMIGATVLMASIVYSFQRYFEYQIEEGRKISQ
jgi:hypothetical protein